MVKVGGREGVSLSHILSWPAFLGNHFIFLFFLVSTARPNVIKEHVSKFLMHVGAVYGDTTFTEFDDNFLRDHVRTVAVCDTELVTTERQVIKEEKELKEET